MVMCGLIADASAIFTFLLLAILGMIAAVGLIFTYLVRRYRSKQTLSAPVTRPNTVKKFRPDVHPLILQEPSGWLAIRSRNLRAIQQALRLNNTTVCTAPEGLACLAGNKLFISSPIGPWALVLGAGLPNPSHDIDKCYHFLAGLSAELGHIEFFWRNRGLSYHAWVQAECGQIIRAYAWAGETLWNYGPLTRAERELRLTCLAYGQEIQTWPFSRATPRANTEKVHLLAQKWSLDPMAIGEDIWSEGHGITGELSHSICG